MQEMQGGAVRLPGHPHAFIKNANAVIGPGEPIRLPRQCPGMVDFEGEFSIVIGRRCHNVTAKEAKSYIGGYTTINDVSARDWNPAKGGTPDWDMIHMGKQLPTFCPLGPAVVTAEEIPDPDCVRLVTRLNGEVMQDANTDDLVFPIAQIIAYFSRWYPFAPGDVITTGTPSGVGFARRPPVFLKAGDVVSVCVEPIGELSNPVVRPSQR
jgi:2-keto-4-pentenoate hydratase/2-oxohepta-3-ene-1,7-dioic acid hydratase in catechol pathway